MVTFSTVIPPAGHSSQEFSMSQLFDLKEGDRIAYSNHYMVEHCVPLTDLKRRNRRGMLAATPRAGQDIVEVYWDDEKSRTPGGVHILNICHESAAPKIDTASDVFLAEAFGQIMRKIDSAVADLSKMTNMSEAEAIDQLLLRASTHLNNRREALGPASTVSGLPQEVADPDAERARARAVETGLDAAAVDGFAGMDRETLILQAALWHSMSMAHQNRSLDVEIRSGEAIGSLFDLCRENKIEVPDEIYEASCSISDRWTPGTP
jgi:hypothetical protein